MVVTRTRLTLTVSVSAVQLCCLTVAIPLIKACFLSRHRLSMASISVLLLRMMAFSVVSR